MTARSSIETLVMAEALNGLGDPQSDLSTAYAVSLLPEPFRSGWQVSSEAVTRYYKERDVLPTGWDVCATHSMRSYHSNISHFLKTCAAVSSKGYSDKRLTLEVQNCYRHYSDFNVMSDNEKSWFLDLRSCYRWRFLPPKLTKMLRHMGPIMWLMSDADRLEDFDQKLRSVTREWLALAVSEAGR